MLQVGAGDEPLSEGRGKHFHLPLPHQELCIPPVLSRHFLIQLEGSEQLPRVVLTAFLPCSNTAVKGDLGEKLPGWRALHILIDLEASRKLRGL